MNCPKCGKKGYVVTSKMGTRIIKTWYCSYCFNEWPDVVPETKEESVKENVL